MEEQEVLLPELLSVNWAPTKLAALANFLLKLVNGRESLLVFIKELEDALKQSVNVIVNPVTVLKLHHGIEYADIRHNLVAALACVLQIIEEKKDDSHNFFLVEVVKNLDCLFNQTKVKVLEALQSELMI